MGLLLQKMKRYDESLHYFESALDIQITKLGEDHSDVANARFNLGTH
jgi:hypothetical protein